MELRHRYITKDTLTFDVIYKKLKEFYELHNFNTGKSTLEVDTERVLKIISNILYRQRVYLKNKSEDYRNDWVELSSRLLIKQVTNKYNRFLLFLIYYDIIEVRRNKYTNKESYSNFRSLDKTVKINNFAKSYRINKKYINDKTIIGEFKSKKLVNSINRSSEHHYKKLQEIYKHLHSFLDKLSIKSHFYLKEHESIMKHFLSQKYANDIMVDKSGRNYHKMTNLPSTSRMYLQYDNKQLVSIDCANSQPLLLLILLRESRLYDSNEYNFYKQLVETGELYDYLINIYNNHFLIKFTNKKEFKQALFKDVYFNYKHKYKNPIIITFSLIFPEIYEFIKENSTYKDELSFKLRKVESNIWIKNIAFDFMNLYPNEPTFILHDSIYILESHIDIAKKIILETFKKYDLNPTLHIGESFKDEEIYKFNMIFSKPLQKDDFKLYNKLKDKVLYYEDKED